MSTQSHILGHVLNWEDAIQMWVYEENGGLLKPEDGKRLKCVRCGEGRTDKGHDPCIADLPGVRMACCGHGDEFYAYVSFNDGHTVRGNEAIKIMEELKNDSRI